MVYKKVRLKTKSSPVKQPDTDSARQSEKKIIEEGFLRGAFRGFRNRTTFFEFREGGRWRQDEDQYLYHYFNKAYAYIYQENDAYYLHVEGMDMCIKVVATPPRKKVSTGRKKNSET
ncbi:hypothetical protein [Spirosoma sp.]|uniref:hypothetical protein n=1 Tax=Spirosoma sp. TaxID=1899569 RepID=UPI002636B031|nr:hypothetical protein [Spirosoma sp.]MCX6218439.1 hypothetical protein [Spirosoma sp.]